MSPLPGRVAMRLAASLAGVLLASGSLADEAAIRANLAARLPNLPKIDAIARSPMPGVWEVRLGSQVIYSDAQGSFVIEGELIDTQRRRNITRERVEQLTAFDFARLPLQDAVVWRQGSGARKLVVFADPNCGYCRRLEQDLSAVRDITVYTFLIPILGDDSAQRSRDIWCARDSGRAWRNWMLNGTAPPAAGGSCDTAALSRNLALSQKHGIAGTPALVFENSERVPGILSAAELERKLALLGRAKG